MSLADHKQLDVWVKSMDVAVAVYDAVKHMPSDVANPLIGSVLDVSRMLNRLHSRLREP